MTKKSKATKPAAEKKKAEEVKVEEVTQVEVVDKAKETGDYPPTEQSKKEDVQTAISKNPEPIIPEVVESKEQKDKKKEEVQIPSISAGLNKIAEGDRIDHNHAIDLMKMIHTEHVTNPATPPELAKAMKTQFDGMALIELMYYNAQVENDFQQLGIKVNNTMFVQMEKVAREIFGITLKGLPAPDDPKQMVINFSESVPEKDKEVAKEDLKAKKSIPEIPEPDVNMPEAKKFEVLKSIFSHVGNGIGSNINTAIEWGRKAFGFEATERKSVIFASLLSHDFRTTLTNGLTGMVRGKLNSDHSIIGAHALLHQWLPSYTDQEIADIAQVCLAYRAEANKKDFKEKGNIEVNLDNELSLISKEIAAGLAKPVIDGILSNKEQVASGKDKLGDILVNTLNIRKNLITSYGDSDNIIKDKVNEIVKYYVKPIMRLSNYIDKSAYANS